MAPALVSPNPTPAIGGNHFSSTQLSSSRRVSGMVGSDTASNNGAYRHLAHRMSSKRAGNMTDTSHISSVVYTLKRHSGDELGSGTSSRLFSPHSSILDWIRAQRMDYYPPDGSSYDKVLSWAQLFVERLHSFDLAIEEFAGDSYLAAQLSYGYCGILLELGRSNAPALMTSFGFFYTMSVSLVNLLERVELFSVTQEIREQLVLALSDLVTLVASVSTHFHKAIRGLTTASVSINIYGVFQGQIKTFRERCEKIAESMWRHQLLKENLEAERVSDVKSIQQWIAPEDHIQGNAMSTVSHLAHDREESTCVWVGPYLARFLKSSLKQFSISGKPGSGKTVLASVIVDHLQHPIGGVTFNTLFVPINGRVPAEATPRAVAKALLSQLFEKRIGNIQLLQILFEAQERSRKTVDDSEYDNILWDALERALSCALPGARELIIVVDGLDEASCGEKVLFQRLTRAVADGANVKLITLGAEKPTATTHLASVVINQDLISDDIMTVTKGLLKSSKAFAAMHELEQDTMITRIAEASNGSMLWASLATKQVRSEKTAEHLSKAVESLLKAKLKVNDFVLHTVQSSEMSDDAKSLLLMLAAAERPLSLRDIATLWSVRTDKGTIVDQKIDVLQILRPANSLVFLQDGLIFLRHAVIRAAVLDAFAKGKLNTPIKDAYDDLVSRLLVYIKVTVVEEHENSLTGLDWYDVNQLFHRYPLLDFATRHWPSYFTKTAKYLQEGEQAAKSVSKFFPGSTAVFRLQKTVWEQKPTPVRVAYQALATTVCRSLLPSDNQATLQSIIFLALSYRDTVTARATSLFYDASVMSRNCLTARHAVTMQVANIYLELTATQVTSSKTEIMTRREEILLLIVECYKAQQGSTSENVLAILKQLREHYQLTKEEHKVQEISTKIRSITHGHVEDAMSDTEDYVEIHQADAEEHTRSVPMLFDTAEHDELIDVHGSYDFETLFKQAEKYVAEGRFELAERIYVEVWQRASREYRAHYSETWETRKLKAVLGYSKFLRSQKRSAEASSILTSSWEEYRNTSISTTETSAALFQEMAMVMKTVGSSVTALSVLKHCSQYYQSASKTQTSSYKQIQQSLQATSMEIMESSSSSTTVTSETTLEEMVIEASASVTQVTQTTFTATTSLLHMYTSQHRWQDATRLIKKMLHGLWPSLFLPNVEDVTLPLKHVDNCVELAERLSECYHARRRATKEKEMRVRVYRAVRSDRKVEDKLRERVTAELLAFFRRTGQAEETISIRQEMLDDFTKHYGPEHGTVIKTLWELAELTRPRPIFVEYYEKIIRALNKDSEISKPEAFEPLVIVSTELWSKGLFADALRYYRILFATFLKQPKLSPKLGDQTFVQDLFSRYTQCLRSVRTDYLALHTVAVDYQSQCKVVFSASASITIKATLYLAKVSQESKRFELEAVTLYEELLQMKSDEIDRQEVSATLDSIYEEQAAIVASTSSTKISSSQVERAVKVLRKRISTVRQTLGWAHEESLSKLTELVSFHSRQEETEMVVEELREATVNVVSSETSSVRLIAAASTIASSYVSTGQVTKATELTEEIYRQIIMKDTSNTKTCGFDLSARGRQSLVYLAQFEHSLRRNNSATMTETLAVLTAQYVYFEEFRGLVSSKTSAFSAVIVSAARLHQFLITSHRDIAAAKVFNELSAYFGRTEGKRVHLVQPSQVDIFLQTILHYFSTHRSRDFIRSLAICANEHVAELLKAKKYDAACDLTLSSFAYISAHDAYRTLAVAKLVLMFGMAVSGQDLASPPDEGARKKMRGVSAAVVKDVLGVLSRKVNLATQLSLVHLNTLAIILGEQSDLKPLGSLLTILWDNRQKQPHNWPASVKYNLGRRYIMVQHLTGDSTSALRLAKDVFHNVRRVHGTRHPMTLETSVLLSRLYTTLALRYQAQKGAQDMAKRYYKKAAAVHEDILRVLSDPSYDSLEGNGLGGDSGLLGSLDGSNYGGFFNNSSQPDTGLLNDLPTSPAEQQHTTISDGEHARQHLRLLKLALERLGSWPKDYAEYERLNADVFREFADALKGVEGVEKWNLGGFGNGKAEGDEDLLSAEVGNWELVDGKLLNGQQEDVD
ncbi:NACHT domain protein [Xylariomycetidae sp. FL2044]|nr:NACHT domain protein [Xylariomycetidae sp. FL2044]